MRTSLGREEITFSARRVVFFVVTVVGELESRAARSTIHAILRYAQTPPERNLHPDNIITRRASTFMLLLLLLL